MSNIKKERDKDISDFHYLCKDLFKIIRRRIIKKYVFPEISLFEEEPRHWKYYKDDDENVTEEDKLCNLFKDNAFLKHIQEFYESLVIINNILDENKKNFEMSQKEIEIGEKKINLLFEVNCQLNQLFNPGTYIPLDQKNKFNGKNSQNITSHLSIIKLSNILNELKIINTLKDFNNMKEDKSNNNSSEISIVYENNIKKENNYIDNNSSIKIMKENFKKEENIINNDIEDEIQLENQIPFKGQNIINTSYNNNIKSESSNSYKKELKFLSRKTKRENDIKRKSEKYIDIFDSNLIDIIKAQNNYDRSNNDKKQIIKKEDNYYKKEPSSHDDNSEISENQNIEKENNENIKLDNSINFDGEYNNSNNISNNESMIFNKELEFEKELKRQFSCLFSNEISNKDIIQEINKILKKIPEIKFPKNKNKFENPSVIGAYKHFDTKFLLDSFPAIDIILKCKDIESREEINDISKEIMSKNLGLNYIEIKNDYENENEIAKVVNKFKIKIKENDFFFYITLFFVNVGVSSYIKKEKCINKYMLSNEIYNNKDKILICLFFRRWRRRFKLFFIMPEFLDILIDFYYKENISISTIIKRIFFDLINEEINFFTKKGKTTDDKENMKEIFGFIREWFNIQGHNKSLINAIISINDYFLKSDYYSLFKID